MARDIVARRVEPYLGAASIWARMAEEDDDYPESFRVFIGLASEWQDHPECRAALEADIRDEARQLIGDASVDGGGAQG